MLDAILFAHEEIKRICAFIENIKNEIGKPEKEVTIHKASDEINDAVREYAADKVVWSVDTFDRDEREARQEQVKQEVIEHFAEQFPDGAADIADVLYYMTKEVIRGKILNDGIRPVSYTHLDV